MSRAVAGVDYCEHCSVIPRHPCHSAAEARNCPNSYSYDPESDGEKIERLKREVSELADIVSEFLAPYEGQTCWADHSLIERGRALVAKVRP